jgi:hypothetical protein
MYIYIYMYTHPQEPLHERLLIWIASYIYTYTHIHKHSTHTHTHTYINTRKNPCMNDCSSELLHIHTHTHTHINTVHTHIYTYTYIHTRNEWLFVRIASNTYTYIHAQEYIHIHTYPQEPLHERLLICVASKWVNLTVCCSFVHALRSVRLALLQAFTLVFDCYELLDRVLCVHVCMCVCMYTHMMGQCCRGKYTCVCIYIYTHTLTYRRTYLNAARVVIAVSNAYVRARVCIYIYTHTHIHTHVPECC